MWGKIKALPLRVKIIALVVFIALGGIYKNFINPPSSSSRSRSSYISDASAAAASIPAPSDESRSTNSSQTDSSQVLAKLQTQWNLLQNQNAQCAVQIQQMNPWNYSAPPCEAQMQWNTAQMAKLEAEIYRLKTGADVQPVDFVLMGSSSSSGTGAASSDDGSNAVNRYSREAILGQSKYTDSDGHEYQLANEPYYYKDRASGRVVPSNLSQPPDNQHDWEQLTYQPN